MEETQSFRLVGGTEVEEILCGHVDGQCIVYWEDIVDVFPGIKHVKNGNVTISPMRDSNRKRCTPRCIKHYPGVVLDVILSSVAEHVHVESPTTAPSPAPTNAANTNLLANHITPYPPTNLRTSHAVDSPVSIQSRPYTFLGRPNQFHENPFPRLPIVLPMAVRRVGDIVKLSPNKFKLYFLCECVAHTSKEGKIESERVHLADHAGYYISQPARLFERFGTYILAVMKAVRAEVPLMLAAALAGLTAVQEIRRVEAHTQEPFSSLVDLAIEYLEGMNKRHDNPDLYGISNPFVLEDENGVGPLWAFVNEDRTLGNLYRNVTEDSEVYWVCQAHFRQSHDEESMIQFIEIIEKNCGSFEVEIGKVDIRLENETMATAFFKALGQVQCVQHLRVTFTWNAPQSSLQSLADAILKSNVISLQFSDYFFGPSLNNYVEAQRRFDPLIHLLAKGRIQLVRLLSFDDFFQQVSCVSAFNSFPTIRKMWTMNVSDEKQYVLFLEMVKKSNTLQKIMTSFPACHAHTWVIQCIKACPSLQELELLCMGFDYSAVFDLIDCVAPLLTQQRGNDKKSSQLSLTTFKVQLGGESVTAIRSESGKMFVSTSWRTTFLNPFLLRFGWTIKECDFYMMSAKDYLDFRCLAQSIEDHGGVSSLQSMCIDESQLAPGHKLSLMKIIEHSEGLKKLELTLDRLNENEFADSVKWCLVNLGPRLTTLHLMLREGEIHPKITPLLSRGRFPRLREVTANFNMRQNCGDIRWLINLLSEDSRSRSRQIQVSDSDAPALVHLNLNGLKVQDDNWKLLIETLDFKSLTRLSLRNSSILLPQWTLLLDRLPEDGLWQDGSPVLLKELDISSTPLEQVFEDKRETLEAQLAERAPFAKLSFKDTPFF